MLFERVPLLYGSGVIPTRFEEFKSGIKQLIVQEFFSREHIERFFDEHGLRAGENLGARIDFDACSSISPTPSPNHRWVACSTWSAGARRSNR